MIVLKKPEEIAKMREGGRLVARAIREMSEAIVPGKTTTGELDQIARRVLKEGGATPSFLGYRGFPAAACISVNEEVIHGIPGPRTLQEGDIVTLDVGAQYDGWCADGAWTYPVGRIDPALQRLLNVTRESLMQGIAKVKAGCHTGDISATIQRYVESNGYTIVRDAYGHGIGRSQHEEPNVPNFGKPGAGPILREGATLCIEPMVNLGGCKTHTLKDDWTVVTSDGKRSAHFEHMIAVTRTGADILTLE